ncbi:c-type cytochrome [Bradyrhizobium sp. WSM 1738]|uniref:c-type cytochrome n=1 Tax=Bradyrhizobium hereditatis TaxID=2821405 RepID=UPI001CE292FC|nr:c-type cytochrome [Bradyrhizobium hereditatis]MCA6119197.1 c-type cytochrome [Bradyrhizobium hereditatis]
MPFAPSSHRWKACGAAGLLVASATVAGAIWNRQQQSEVLARALVGGDPARAPPILRRYGCAGCHTIPGIPGADGQVGGALSGIKHRVYVGGVALNSPDNLVRWIVAPQALSPRSAMPATGISDAEARDVVAYLYSR